jgi:hypothetical protein
MKRSEETIQTGRGIKKREEKVDTILKNERKNICNLKMG